MIAHNRPLIAEEDLAAAEAVLRSGWIAPGPQVSGLEEDFVRFFGGGGACACSSGTAALYLALRGLGLGPGARVAVPTYSCSALLNAVHFCGAQPVPVDVRLDDFTMDDAALAQLSRPVAAAIAVHAFGAPANIPALKGTAPLVIEDCCQSPGGRRQGQPLGAQGDAAVFSFYATKIITCGSGGLVWDRSGKAAAWARDFREFDCREEYTPRFNFHSTDFQAAMVRSQFARLEAIMARRQSIVRRYLEALPRGIGLQAGLDDAGRMPHRFVLVLASREHRDALLSYFAAGGVKAVIPLEPYELLHRYLHLDASAFPNAERLVDTTLSLPLYPALSDQEIEQVAELLAKADAP